MKKIEFQLIGIIHLPRKTLGRNPVHPSIEYAKRIDYKKLGLVFYIGLIKEAEKVAEIREV